jgi:hypothetical protein
MRMKQGLLLVLVSVFILSGTFVHAEETMTHTQTQTITTTTTVSTVTLPPEKGFWETTWDGTKTAGAYTWKGIKWTGRGIAKGGYYMKEGAISFAETVGLKQRDDEIAFTEKLVNQSNKTLVESQTLRQIREDKNQRLDSRIKTLSGGN